MPLTLPSYVTAHKGDATLRFFNLLSLGGPVPQYLTDCDHPIVYGGQTYLPTRSLSIDGLGAADGQDAQVATVSVGNGDAAFGVLVSAFVGSHRSPAVTVYEAWLDASATSLAVLGAYVRLSGAVEAPEWDSNMVRFSVVPKADGTVAKLPALAYSEDCPYLLFKGPECGYGGAATSCDRSWTVCATLGNSARFGGLRGAGFLPADGTVLRCGGNGSVEITLRSRGAGG